MMSSSVPERERGDVVLGPEKERAGLKRAGSLGIVLHVKVALGQQQPRLLASLLGGLLFVHDGVAMENISFERFVFVIIVLLIKAHTQYLLDGPFGGSVEASRRELPRGAQELTLEVFGCCL